MPLNNESLDRWLRGRGQSVLDAFVLRSETSKGSMVSSQILLSVFPQKSHMISPQSCCRNLRHPHACHPLLSSLRRNHPRSSREKRQKYCHLNATRSTPRWIQHPTLSGPENRRQEGSRNKSGRHTVSQRSRCGDF